MTAQDLKNSILQLAVQGKLVPQCKDDEPASELVRQIIKERNQNDNNHFIGSSSVSEEEISFDIPESWILLRLGDFCQICNGNSINATVKQKKYSRQCSGYSYIATKDLGFDHFIDYDNGIYIPKEETGFKIAIAGSILLCMEGGSAGKKIGILTRDVCFGNKLCCFTPYVIDCQYLYYYLQSPMFFSDFLGSMTGLIGGVGSAKLKNLLCPIPPLAEQKRIVAKIEELMPLIEEYGKEEEQLSKLNAEFPDKLRKSILQQAVQGKLTERDPADESASVLLKRIKAEKEALIKAGKIKKEKPLPAITDDAKPFDIPDTWEWVRLSDVAEVSRGKSKHRPRNDKILYENGDIPLIQTGDVARANNVILDCSAYYNETGLAQSRLWKKGTLCLTIAANIADVAILGIDACFPDSVVGINGYASITSNKYFMYMLEAFQEILDRKATKSAQKNLSVDTILSVAYPLPPLAEQKRIVKRVEELLTLCDELK